MSVLCSGGYLRRIAIEIARYSATSFDGEGITGSIFDRHAERRRSARARALAASNGSDGIATTFEGADGSTIDDSTCFRTSSAFTRSSRPIFDARIVPALTSLLTVVGGSPDALIVTHSSRPRTAPTSDSALRTARSISFSRSSGEMTTTELTLR